MAWNRAPCASQSSCSRGKTKRWGVPFLPQILERGADEDPECPARLDHRDPAGRSKASVRRSTLASLGPVLVCPSCGEENPERARFCLNCGTPLREPLAPAEERKVVTVLFCDLVGFTARSDKADPE